MNMFESTQLYKNFFWNEIYFRGKVKGTAIHGSPDKYLDINECLKEVKYVQSTKLTLRIPKLYIFVGQKLQWFYKKRNLKTQM